MRVKRIGLSLFIFSFLFILTTVNAYSLDKKRLIKVFSYVKQANIFCQKRENPRHSIYSHSGWAKHQNIRQIIRATMNQLFELSLNYSRLQKKRMIKVFAYLKQAKLYLKKLEGSQHSIYSHSGWARVQKWKRIKMAVKETLKIIGFDIIKLI